MLQELRFAIRSLARQPGFTAVAVLTLALGIGMNTALFSAVEAVFLRPMPYEGADRLMFLSASFPGSTRGGDNFSWPDFADLSEQAGSFEAVAAHHDFSAVTLTGADEPQRLVANFVSASYFDVFRARAQLGRTFAPEETLVPSSEAVAVLSDAFWQRQFGADPSVIGRKLVLNQTPVTVVGVMEPAFRDLQETWRPQVDLWMPMGLSDAVLGQNMFVNRGGRVFYGVARLGDGVTLQQARQELAALSQRLEAAYPDTNRGYTFHVQPLRDRYLGSLFDPVLLLLAGAGFILLIGAANVANLLLARLAGRRRELAVCAALGASRSRIVRQLMLEAALLAAAGAALGFVLAGWTVDALAGWDALQLPAYVQIRLDGGVLAASSLVVVVVALLFGAVPAMEGARVDLRDVLSQSARGGGVRRQGLRRALTVAEVGLSLLLLVGAGLMLRSFHNLAQYGVGYPTHNLLSVRLDLRGPAYDAAPSRVRFAQQLIERVQNVGGVESAVILGPSDLGRGSWVAFLAPQGSEVRGQEDLQMVSRHSVNPGALGHLGIPILRGRDLAETDTADSPLVAVVSESVAQKLWPQTSALGQRFWWQGRNAFIEVVGIAADAVHRERFHPRWGAMGVGPQFDIYMPYAQVPNRSVVLAVRTQGDPAGVVGGLREAVLALDSNLPIYNAKKLEDRMREEEGPTQAVATLLGVYAAMALLLAALGIYSVLAQGVSQRTAEFGIRMALGAAPRDILRLVLGQGMRLAAAGLAAGLVASVALTRVMSSLLFGVGATDVATFAVVSVLLAVVALAACWIPARRATKVDPIVALRYE